MRLERLRQAANAQSLTVLGVCPTHNDEDLGDGSIVLLGPLEPGFWAAVNECPEFQDGVSDPLDRWSERVIGGLAAKFDGRPLFPFGEPARPFISWALRSNRAWASPVGLLVHDEAGLLVSYRGAILLPEQVEQSSSSARPCDACVSKPCLSACPASALTKDLYDLKACHAFLDQPDGHTCLSQGCAVRLSCPLSQNYPRDLAQSAFHMSAFHPSGES